MSPEHQDEFPDQNGHEAEAQDSEAAAEPVAEGEAEAPAANMHWYIVHTYSGFENKVAESLRTRSEAFGFSHRIGQILIPTEEVVELRNGKKVTSKKQAIAIGLSQAREAGGKVPRKKSAAKKK